MQARWFRHVVNWYAPYLGAGIHVVAISDDWRYVCVELRSRFYNRNYVGTHFGGSLFAMADPFYMIMVIRNLGGTYLVWDKAAEIEFVAPGRGTITAEFRLTDADLDDLKANTAGGEKYLRWFAVELRAADGTTVARVRKQLYVRRKPAA